WAKDAVGNVSASRSATTVIDNTAPTVITFTIPATANTLTIAITALTASDNVSVTGYLLTETQTAPLASAAGWSTTVPTSYTSATANDAVGVIGVQFTFDGLNQGSEVTSGPPYTTPWNTTLLSEGGHSIGAAARDAAGNIGTTGVDFTIDRSPPTGNITAPTA